MFISNILQSFIFPLPGTGIGLVIANEKAHWPSLKGEQFNGKDYWD
jgi:hypothetical protein